MAIRKVAYAQVVRPDFSVNMWTKRSKVRTASNLVDKATNILGAAFSPEDYLLTHATIVCSVDTFSPGAPTGSVDFEGETINRKYSDFRITKSTEQYINNNLDAFSRSVLLKAYKTFIGAHNFVEHRQVPSESKGRIIDAVIRDVGDSLYVDILVATSRKNKDLVDRIESGDLTTLSMGCNISFSICTKCGNVAIDETEFCQHIKYQKGAYFVDDEGVERKIAELCGHHEVDPHGGVTFIEASWVEDPAFKGAVMRNILTPTESTKKKAESVLSSVPSQWAAERVATKATKTAFDFGDDEGGGEESAPAEPEDPIQKAVDTLKNEITQKAIGDILDEIEKKEKKNAPSDQTLTSTNETLLKEAYRKSKENPFSAVIRSIQASASNERDFLSRIASFHRSVGLNQDVMLYKAVEKNPIEWFSNPSGYIKACNAVLGRTASLKEAKFLIRMGHQFRQFRNRHSEE